MPGAPPDRARYRRTGAGRRPPRCAAATRTFPNRHSRLRHLPSARLCLADASAASSWLGLTPSERAAAAISFDVVVVFAANSGLSAALTRAGLRCRYLATAAMIVGRSDLL